MTHYKFRLIAWKYYQFNKWFKETFIKKLKIIKLKVWVIYFNILQNN